MKLSLLNSLAIKEANLRIWIIMITASRDRPKKFHCQSRIVYSTNASQRIDHRLQKPQIDSETFEDIC